MKTQIFNIRIHIVAVMCLFFLLLTLRITAADNSNYLQSARQLARLLNESYRGEWRQNAYVSGRIIVVDITPDDTYSSYAFRRLYLVPEDLDVNQVEVGGGYVKYAARSGKTIRMVEYGRDAGKLFELKVDAFDIWTNKGDEKQVSSILLQLIQAKGDN